MAKHHENHLNAKQRAALVRESFDAIAAVGFIQWTKECSGDLNHMTEGIAELRKAYVEELKKIAWPEFQERAAKASDAQLYSVLEEFTERADALAPMAYGHATWEGLAKEIRTDEGLRKQEDEQRRGTRWLRESAPQAARDVQPSREDKDRGLDM